MTGNKPYAYFPQDTVVISSAQAGVKPDRVKYLPTVFPDPLWTLMDRCWNYNPNDRPDIALVKEKLEKM